MSKYTNLLLLAILGVADAWMIAHPNFMGRAGIFIYKYSMIKNFPTALMTVFLTLGICYSLAFFFGKNKSKKWALAALIACFLLSLVILVQVVLKFNTGMYAHTGAAFRFGMILLPVLMLFIFGSELFSKKNQGQH
jgi:hypothetical protein